MLQTHCSEQQVCTEMSSISKVKLLYPLSSDSARRETSSTFERVVLTLCVQRTDTTSNHCRCHEAARIVVLSFILPRLLRQQSVIDAAASFVVQPWVQHFVTGTDGVRCSGLWFHGSQGCCGVASANCCGRGNL